MTTPKLLIVEDNDDDMKLCRDSVKRFNKEKKKNVEIVGCRTKEEAFNLLDSSFDGAIIDLKLPSGGTEGNEVVKYIQDKYWRIPIMIFTATPVDADSEYPYVGVYKKGEKTYSELVERLCKVYDTGLTRILGGRGEIEKFLNMVFANNILPKLDIWIKYADLSPEAIPRVMLRFTLNHLMQVLENDVELFLPEEVYICPPLINDIKTGSIVKRKGVAEYRIVLNPACDLIIRASGKPKTDHFLLAEIEDEVTVSKEVISDIKKDYKQEKKIEELLKNNHCDYYHWLPKTTDFQGGFINFRKIFAFTEGEFNGQFEPPKIEVSQQFVKDIVARFSSYYGRQGQPDIDFDRSIKNLLKLVK
jgi:CheY-like chemotaxis protein